MFSWTNIFVQSIFCVQVGSCCRSSWFHTRGYPCCGYFGLCVWNQSTFLYLRATWDFCVCLLEIVLCSYEALAGFVRMFLFNEPDSWLAAHILVLLEMRKCSPSFSCLLLDYSATYGFWAMHNSILAFSEANLSMREARLGAELELWAWCRFYLRRWSVSICFESNWVVLIKAELLEFHGGLDGWVGSTDWVWCSYVI